MQHPTDRIIHTTAFVTPVMEHWLERDFFFQIQINVDANLNGWNFGWIKWIDRMKDRKNNWWKWMNEQKTMYGKQVAPSQIKQKTRLKHNCPQYQFSKLNWFFPTGSSCVCLDIGCREDLPHTFSVWIMTLMLLQLITQLFPLSPLIPLFLSAPSNICFPKRRSVWLLVTFLH